MKIKKILALLTALALALSLTSCGIVPFQISDRLPEDGDGPSPGVTTQESFYQQAWHGDVAFEDMEYEHYDPEQLTGSSRIYANAKPGIIMEAFSAAGESNLVFIINELDKAASGKGNGNPADVLLTLLDNLGFTDNYMECMIPTVGVYPIATANEKDQISAPLMSRFAVIDIPDYTDEEKKVIFSKFALPKVLRRMSLKENECQVAPDGLDAVIEKYRDTTGIRDLEQAAEHIAANALYQIEVDHVSEVVFHADMVRSLLG